jgi:hypothetical protein
MLLKKLICPGREFCEDNYIEGTDKNSSVLSPPGSLGNSPPKLCFDTENMNIKKPMLMHCRKAGATFLSLSGISELF